MSRDTAPGCPMRINLRTASAAFRPKVLCLFLAFPPQDSLTAFAPGAGGWEELSFCRIKVGLPV